MTRVLAVFLIAAVFVFPAISSSRDLAAIYEDLDINGPERATVAELAAYVAAGKNPPAEAVLRLARAYSQRKEYREAAEAYERLIRLSSEGFKYEALYEYGYVSIKAGRHGEARMALERISSEAGAPENIKAKAARLLSDIGQPHSTSGDSALPAIGALLPLSGEYAQFGEDTLSGVLLAAEVFGEAPGLNIEIVVRDASDPSKADSTVKELAGNARIAGLVGPLLSSTAFEAARSAQRQGVPVITLSQKDGVTDIGENVFRNFITPVHQASSIARFAVKRLGKKRIAVLHPQTNYGAELARHFEKEVKRLGGEISRAGSYQPGTTDFSDIMKRLFAVQVKERTEGRRKIKEFVPTSVPEAIYIPDSFESVAIILPFLDYYKVSGVQLLGSNGWNSPRLAASGGRAVEGAYFVDGFFAESKREGTGEFIKRFTLAYGRPPGVLEAQAYDATMALIQAMGLSKGELPDRRSVREGLARMKGPRGAAGAISFNQKREAERELFILTVKDGRIVEAE